MTEPQKKSRPNWLETDAGKEAVSKLLMNPDSQPATPTQPSTKPEINAPKLVALRVGEQTYDVAEEVARGFLRQEDYTRKTQNLAAQRRELQNRKYALEEFEKDPRGWIERYHPDLLTTADQPKGKLDEAQTAEEKDLGQVALEKVEDLELRQKVREEEQRIESECLFLANTYPEAFNRAEVLDVCLKNKIASPIQAFKEIHFDRMDKQYQDRINAEVERRVAEVLVSQTKMLAEEPADASHAALPTPKKSKPKNWQEAREQAMEIVTGSRR